MIVHSYPGMTRLAACLHITKPPRRGFRFLSPLTEAATPEDGQESPVASKIRPGERGGWRGGGGGGKGWIIFLLWISPEGKMSCIPAWSLCDSIYSNKQLYLFHIFKLVNTYSSASRHLSHAACHSLHWEYSLIFKLLVCKVPITELTWTWYARRQPQEDFI